MSASGVAAPLHSAKRSAIQASWKAGESAMPTARVWGRWD